MREILTNILQPRIEYAAMTVLSKLCQCKGRVRAAERWVPGGDSKKGFLHLDRSAIFHQLGLCYLNTHSSGGPYEEVAKYDNKHSSKESNRVAQHHCNQSSWCVLRAVLKSLHQHKAEHETIESDRGEPVRPGVLADIFCKTAWKRCR